jgi:acylphosphatase
MLKQVHVIFRGRVQGVGFRFSAMSLAKDMDVKGWVTNLPDGTVEVVAEQDEPVLDDFLSRLDKEFAGYISGREISWKPETRAFQGFGIRI